MLKPDIQFIFNRESILTSIQELSIGGIENPKQEYFQIQIQNLYEQLIKEVPELKWTEGT